MSIYLKWLGLTVLDWLLIPTVLVAAPVISLFTREESYEKKERDEKYTWGWIYGTHDNPPQGDQGFVEKRSWFPGETKGFKGYLNRVNWMLRNPLYGLAIRSSIPYSKKNKVESKGNLRISDKYKRPGSYTAKVINPHGKVIGWEYYLVKPYSESKCIRIRLGWKIMTDKYKRFGFAQLVNSFSPFKKYGDD